jgi:hypothetical protein
MYQPSKEEFERHRIQLPERGTEAYSALCEAFTAPQPRMVMRAWGGFTYRANAIEINPIADAVQVATEWGQSWQSS